MVGAAILFVWMLLSLYGIKKHNYISINILIIMAVMQNFVLVISSPYISKTIFNLFIFIKEIYVVLLIVSGYVRRPKFSKFELGCFLCIFVIVFYSLIYGSSSISGVLASVRQLYLPFFFLLLGCISFSEHDEIKKSMQFFIKMMVISVFFGLIEMKLGDEFWIRIGYSAFAKLKSIESGLTSDTGISGAFYSWDLGIRIRRMGSFLAEPVILGQLFAIALVAAIFYKGLFKNKIQKYMIIFILALGLLFTLAKGGIIIALFAFAFIMGKIWHKQGLAMMTKIAFVIILSVGVVYTFISGANGVTHIGGLIDNLRYLPNYPFGRGVGSVGNLGYNYGGRGTLVVNGESFIGAAIGQIGVVAIIIYSYYYGSIFKILKRSSKDHLYDIGYIALYLNVGLFLTSLINNTAISFTSCFIYYIIAGGLYKIYLKEQKNLVISGGCNGK